MRRTVRPPEPVDVSNPQWVARAWQWVFDQLQHIDECVDTMKDSHTEFKAEVFSLIAAGKVVDGSLEERIDDHQAFHDQMDVAHKAKRSQLSQAWNVARDGARAGYDVGKFVLAIGVGKAIGIL
jgi:hypothetical protein